MTDRLPDPIPLTRPSTGPDELAAVAAVLDSGWLAGQGPQGALLEEEFAALSSRTHAIAVNNCTAGLHLAVEALGLSPGDEVIVPDYTFPATAHAVLYAGAVPRFADVRPDTATVDPASVRERITSRTRGIIGVDALGVPADWDDLARIAAENELWLLEDAACSAGATYRGQPCGSFGDMAVFSLHARKGVTSGEGGVVVTDDADRARQVRSASCFGMASALDRQNSARLEIPEFPDLGYNYKLSDILAAIARVQLGKIEAFLAARRAAADRYAALLAEVPGVQAPQVPDDRVSAWQTYAVTVDRGIDRDDIVLGLRERGIGSNIGTYALNGLGVYRETRRDCPVSDDLFARQLALPLFPELTAGAQERVVSELAALLAR